MVIKNKRLMNYLLTICFILFIISFLTSLVFISRYALSDVVPIRSHVENTQDLLQDISEVGKVASSNTTSPSPMDQDIKKAVPINYGGIDVSSVSLIQANENKSFLAFTIQAPIEQFDNIYYVPRSHINEFRVGDTVLPEFNNQSIAQIVEIEGETATIVSIYYNEIEKFSVSKLLGKVIFVQK